MKRIILFVLLVLVGSSLTACSVSGDAKQPDTDAAFLEEINELKESHPECFGLDVTNGLNVLVFDNYGQWSIRIVSGSKDHYSLKECVESTLILPLTLNEAKTVLKDYGLPDEKVVLRPYQEESSFYMKIDESLKNRIRDAFENKYIVSDEFKKVFDPDIDSVPNQ